jgi:hypothetical protein
MWQQDALPDDPAPGDCRRHQNQNREPHFPGDRHYHIPEDRRQARARPSHGKPFIAADDELYDRREEEISLDEVERIAI